MIDDGQIAAAIDKLVSGMRGVINDLTPPERERVLASVRVISPMSPTGSKHLPDAITEKTR
jgi:hypothetical protein